MNAAYREITMTGFSWLRSALIASLGFTILSCAHDQDRYPASADVGDVNEMTVPALDYKQAVGRAMMVVGRQAISVVPTSFDSAVPNQVFDQAHPLVLSPGDAFVLKSVDGDNLKIEFDYKEIISGTISAAQFPPSSLRVQLRSDNPLDEKASAADQFLPSQNASLGPGMVRANPHAGGSNCALTPHKPGCCLAAVKYWLRDNKLIRSDLSDFPGVYGKFATQNLPASFASVGCGARLHPTRALVCSYNSSFNPGAGHVEVFDGEGWYFGLGHRTLQKDGHHTCIDCKSPR